MSVSGFLWRIASTAGYTPGADTAAVSTAVMVSGVVAVSVQAAFGYDAAELAPEGAWVDLINIVDVEVARPTSRNLGVLIRYQAATCRVVLDGQDRRYDPSNLSGPYVNGADRLVQPMTPIRVIAKAQVPTDGVYIDVGGAGGTYQTDFPLFRGYADRWTVTYSPAGKTSQTLLTATDGTKALANYNGPELAPQGSGELAGARIDRILDSAGWPEELRQIDTGVATVQATTLAQPAWSELLLTADSERGDVFIDGGGNFTFFDQTHRAVAARSTTPQAEWDDSRAGTIKFTNPTVSVDDTLIYNQIVISNTGGNQQTANDTTSQSKYLTRSLNRTDLVLTSDAAAASYTNVLLAMLKDPYLRFDGFGYSPGSLAEQLLAVPVVLGVQPADRWTVRFTPPGGGDRIVRDVWVAGMRWHFRQSTWDASFTFQSIDSRSETGWTWDDPARAIWDVSTWAY